MEQEKGKPFLVYLIGLSGSGKSTIAQALYNSLTMQIKGKKRVELLDGDDLRQQFGGVFGYTREERMKNNQVVRVLLCYLLKNEISVILAQVAPYQQIRDLMRERFTENYIEVYVKCSPEECKRRDVKGFYQKATVGEIKNLNGADDVYEIPQNSDVICDTETKSPEECVEDILKCLSQRGYI